MNSIEAVEKIALVFQEIQTKNPLVQCITNGVTINDCANALLAVGASPVMAAGQDAAEMAELASSLVLNIGTINTGTEKAMKEAAQVATRRGIPIVLDPVGAGSTPTRLRISQELIQNQKISIIRGNWSEIKAIGEGLLSMKGVDSCKNDTPQVELLKNWAEELRVVLAVTGKEDWITDGKRVCRIFNGDSKLQQITGTGCMSASLCGAYATNEAGIYWGAVAGVLAMSLAGELAVRTLTPQEGSGTLRFRIIDELNLLTVAKIKQESQVNYEI